MARADSDRAESCRGILAAMGVAVDIGSAIRSRWVLGETRHMAARSGIAKG